MSGKKVADVAFKASKSIDWDGMAKMLVSDEARREFFNLRRTFDEVNTAFQTKFSLVFLSLHFSLFIYFFANMGCFIFIQIYDFLCCYLISRCLCLVYNVKCLFVMFLWNIFFENVSFVYRGRLSRVSLGSLLIVNKLDILLCCIRELSAICILQIWFILTLVFVVLEVGLQHPIP